MKRPRQELRQIDQEPRVSRRRAHRRARWCKGRKGIEHDYEWGKALSWIGVGFKRCVNCGRIGARCYGWDGEICWCGMHALAGKEKERDG